MLNHPLCIPPTPQTPTFVNSVPHVRQIRYTNNRLPQRLHPLSNLLPRRAGHVKYEVLRPLGRFPRHLPDAGDRKREVRLTVHYQPPGLCDLGRVQESGVYRTVVPVGVPVVVLLAEHLEVGLVELHDAVSFKVLVLVSDVCVRVFRVLFTEVGVRR